MISVVIPLYNKEKSVRATLESVRAQTYKDWECIVVDDGSTDNSCEVVERIRELESERVRVIHQENAGVSAARNAGIMAAKGEYVAFLDADDIWDKTVLHEFNQLIIDYPQAAMYAIGCGHKSGEKIYPCPSDIHNGYRGIVPDIWEHRPTFLVTAGCCCCTTSLIRDLGGFDTRMTHGEDYDMWWRLLFEGPLAYYNKTLVYYVQDAENRAMLRMPELEKYIPFYIDKYEIERLKNESFRRFCDDELARRLYPYLLNNKTRDKAKELLKKIDWSLLKPSLYWRMQFPRLYAIYYKLKRC